MKTASRFGGKPAAPLPTQTILEAAVAREGFSTFTRAIDAAGLRETLSGIGPFTVFAPTDEAFAKLPAARLEALLAPENRDELASILNYHVMTGRKTALEIGHWDAARTVNGQSTRIRQVGTQVTLDGAQVTPAPAESSNGYLHALDTVNLPPQADA